MEHLTTDDYGFGLFVDLCSTVVFVPPSEVFSTFFSLVVVLPVSGLVWTVLSSETGRSQPTIMGVTNARRSNDTIRCLCMVVLLSNQCPVNPGCCIGGLRKAYATRLSLPLRLSNHGLAES